jgi:hypothetical protein
MTSTTEMMTSTMTLTMMTTTTTTTMMTTIITAKKSSTATMDNIAIIFYNIIMIIWAALGANQQKYCAVSQLYPLGD